MYDRLILLNYAKEYGNGTAARPTNGPPSSNEETKKNILRCGDTALWRVRFFKTSFSLVCGIPKWSVPCKIHYVIVTDI